jgi:peptide alpha-N-acetyltransferase
MAADEPKPSDVEYATYRDASELPQIMALMEKDLSEPYTVFTYRYFIDNWPQFCWLVRQLKNALCSTV